MSSTTIENDWGAVDPEIVEKMHSEAQTRLTAAEAALEVLAANRSSSNIHRVFREFHTMKSVAGFMQLDVAVQLAHDAEDVLDQVRQGSVEPTDELVQVLQDYLQAIGQCVAAAADRPIVPVPQPVEDSFLSIDPRELLKMIRCIDTLSAFVDPSELAATVDIEGKRVIEFIDGILAEMRELACRLQQVGLNETLHQAARVATSLSTHLRRPIDVLIEGEDVRINPRTAGSLRECLIHLVRNAVDHGVEDQGERRRKGKPQRAKLTIEAVREGEYVEVSVADDGGGINLDKVGLRARELGIEVTSETPASEILKVICGPGFSTRSDLTELSGRGVGLDVVASKMRSFGGSLNLQFEENAGTRFGIRFRDTIL